MGILLTILVLTLAVLVHEYGHYVAMRRNGVKVIEFTVGFGPTLWSRTLRSGTEFKLKLFLLGGYTKPLMRMPTDPEDWVPPPDSLEAASAWARFKIFMAGMFFNATAAFLVFAVMNYATGTYLAFTAPYVHAIHTPRFLVPLAGAFFASYGAWLATPVIIVKMALGGFTSFFSSVAGPIGIVSAGNTMIVGGSSSLVVVAMNALFFFAVLNIGLAGFNLVPIMPLDGGRVVDILIEKLCGKYAPKLRKIYMVVGLSLFLLFFVSVMAGDIINVIRK